MYILVIYHGYRHLIGIAKEILSKLDSDGNLEGLLGGEEYRPPLTFLTTETHQLGLPSFLSRGCSSDLPRLSQGEDTKPK